MADLMKTSRYLDEHSIIHWVDTRYIEDEDRWYWEDRVLKDYVRCESWYGSRDCLCGQFPCSSCTFERDDYRLPRLVEETPWPVTCLGCLAAEVPSGD